MKIFKKLFSEPPVVKVNAALKAIAKHRDGDLVAAQNKPVVLSELDGVEKADTDPTAFKAANRLVGKPGVEAVRVKAIFSAVQLQVGQKTTSTSIAQPTDSQLATDLDFAVADELVPLVVRTLKGKVPVKFSCLDLVVTIDLNSSKGQISFPENKAVVQNGIIAVPYEDGKVELITEEPFDGVREIKIPGFLNDTEPCEMVLSCLYDAPETSLKPDHVLSVERELTSERPRVRLRLTDRKLSYPGKHTIDLGSLQIIPVGDGNIRITADEPFDGEVFIKLPLTKKGAVIDLYQLVLKVTYKS